MELEYFFFISKSSYISIHRFGFCYFCSDMGDIPLNWGFLLVSFFFLHRDIQAHCGHQFRMCHGTPRGRSEPYHPALHPSLQPPVLHWDGRCQLENSFLHHSGQLDEWVWTEQIEPGSRSGTGRNQVKKTKTAKCLRFHLIARVSIIFYDIS